jgi:glucose-1-phosphate adenylyltransferase
VLFYEKHKEPALLDQLATYPDAERPYLGSMGVYIFRAEALYRLLDGNSGSDFGKDILPASLATCRVLAYPFDGYWQDIGTIRAFYEANLALVEPDAPFSFYDPDRPIYTHPRFLPPSQIDQDCILHRVLLAGGGKVMRSQIYQSVIGIRSRIGPEARLTRTIMMGADYFESDAERAENVARGRPDVGVGQGCVIEGAILDKNARIGHDVVIRGLPERPDVETEHYVVRDGIVIITKDCVVPHGMVI